MKRTGKDEIISSEGEEGQEKFDPEYAAFNFGRRRSIPYGKGWNSELYLGMHLRKEHSFTSAAAEVFEKENPRFRMSEIRHAATTEIPYLGIYAQMPRPSRDGNISACQIIVVDIETLRDVESLWIFHRAYETPAECIGEGLSGLAIDILKQKTFRTMLKNLLRAAILSQKYFNIQKEIPVKYSLPEKMRVLR